MIQMKVSLFIHDILSMIRVSRGIQEKRITSEFIWGLCFISCIKHLHRRRFSRVLALIFSRFEIVCSCSFPLFHYCLFLSFFPDLDIFKRQQVWSYCNTQAWGRKTREFYIRLTSPVNASSRAQIFICIVSANANDHANSQQFAAGLADWIQLQVASRGL